MTNSETSGIDESGWQDRSLRRRDRSHRLAEIFEVAGAWLGILLGGVLIVQIMLWANQDATHALWRDQRLGISAANLAARLETDLALGLDPVANGSAARAMEETFGRDSTLFSVALVDLDGHILADSDLGSVGSVVEGDLLAQARRHGGEPWQGVLNGRHVQAAPVKTGFGESLAYVMLFSLKDSDHASARRDPVQGGFAMLLVLLALLSLTAVAASTAAWYLVRTQRKTLNEDALSGEAFYRSAQANATRRAETLHAALDDMADEKNGLGTNANDGATHGVVPVRPASLS